MLSDYLAKIARGQQLSPAEIDDMSRQVDKLDETQKIWTSVPGTTIPHLNEAYIDILHGAMASFSNKVSIVAPTDVNNINPYRFTSDGVSISELYTYLTATVNFIGILALPVSGRESQISIFANGNILGTPTPSVIILQTDSAAIVITSPGDGTQSTIVLNQTSNNVDTIIKGGSGSNLVYADASTDRVGIGTATPTSKLHVVGLPPYANNAAAVAAGLTAGAFYRNNADPDMVCVVH